MPPEHVHQLSAPAVLVAEDDSISSRVILAMLNDLAIRADWAENGLQALDKATHNSYDLILMDWQMPVLDGVDATRLIRARSGDRQPAIVMLTARLMEGDKEICLAAGVDEVLVKPLSRQALKRLLVRYTALSKLAARRPGHGEPR